MGWPIIVSSTLNIVIGYNICIFYFFGTKEGRRLELMIDFFFFIYNKSIKNN